MKTKVDEKMENKSIFSIKSGSILIYKELSENQRKKILEYERVKKTVHQRKNAKCPNLL